jgi:membrane-associated phospholipid phosphatase
MKGQTYIKEIIRKCSIFLILYFIILTGCIVLLCNYSKSEIHIWSNIHNTPFLDFFFAKITFFGNGIFVIFLCIIYLFYSFRNSILLFATFAISGIFVQIIKRFVLPGMPRPNIYFKDIYNLHLIKGVEILHSFSFPSGHSATAFALFLCLSLITRKKILQLLYFILACLIAYSRIYLSQHFLMDAVAGSLIGVFTVLLYYYFNQRIKGEWMNKSLLTLKKKTN